MAGICFNLPEEVLEEIFLWVPTESLIRFKCVCKSWYALINSLTKNPEFVNKQLYNIQKKSLSPTSTRLVFCCPGIGYWRHPEMEFLRRDLFKSVTVFHDIDNASDDIDSVREVFHLPTLPSELHLALAFRSHCNGIICLSYGSRVILCNPLIKEWRILPKPCLADGNFRVKGRGFGYDLRANDFKIVRFGHDSSSCRDGIDYFNTRAEVYSMRRDSWREIGIPFQFDRLQFDCSPSVGKEVFCRGVFYWYMRSRKHIILSFDMFHEVFCSIQLPDNLLVGRKDHFIRLSVWNESVALFCYKQEQERAITKSVEVWVMDDYSSGVKTSCSWIKKLIIKPPVDLAFPLAFLKNDEVLMKATVRKFVLYNIHSQAVRNLTFIENTEPDWDFSHLKSLLSVRGGNQSCP